MSAAKPHADTAHPPLPRALKQEMDAVASNKYNLTVASLRSATADISRCSQANLGESTRRKLIQLAINIGNVANNDRLLGGLFLRAARGDMKRASHNGKDYARCLQVLERNTDRDTAGRLQMQRNVAALVNAEHVNAVTGAPHGDDPNSRDRAAHADGDERTPPRR